MKEKLITQYQNALEQVLAENDMGKIQAVLTDTSTGYGPIDCARLAFSEVFETTTSIDRGHTYTRPSDELTKSGVIENLEQTIIYLS